MGSYHTDALKNADIFTVMGSIYAEVARYDAAINIKQKDSALQAAARAKELINYSQTLEQINSAQKLEINKFKSVFLKRVKEYKTSNLDGYLLPFAMSARMRQDR